MEGGEKEGMSMGREKRRKETRTEMVDMIQRRKVDVLMFRRPGGKVAKLKAYKQSSLF